MNDELPDLSAEDILSFKRELKTAEIDGWGKVYYYDPVSIAEQRKAMRHVHVEDNGTFVIDLEGVVDGLIARLKKRDGSPLFTLVHKRRLMEQSSDKLQAIWNAIGGFGAGDLGALVEDAEKK